MAYIPKLLAVAVFLLILAGCGNSSTSPGGMGTLTVSLTDAPGNFEAVDVTFADVSAHIDNDWVTVAGQSQTVNLLDWNNGKSIVLGQADVPAGHYTQIRLMVTGARVVLDGQSHDLTVPSAAQSGLKLGPAFTVEEGTTAELVVDFDAHRSVVATGPPGSPILYQLKPTVRVTPKGLTGSISGMVTNPQSSPIAHAIAAGDTVTSTLVEGDNGAFTLAFLPAGTYAVAVGDTSGLSFQAGSVDVTVGIDQDNGSATLEGPVSLRPDRKGGEESPYSRGAGERSGLS
jgi:hypothetical protein